MTPTTSRQPAASRAASAPQRPLGCAYEPERACCKEQSRADHDDSDDARERSPPGASRSRVIPAVTATMAGTSMMPVTRRTAVRPAQHWLQ